MIQKKKISNVSKPPSQRNKVEKTASQDGSHEMTLTQTKSGRVSPKEDFSSIQSAFYLTVRIQNSQLTRKHFRLILDVLIFEAVNEGVDFYRYLLLEQLLTILFGSKLDPLDLSNEHERRVVILTQIILRSLAGKEFSPDMVEKVQIEENLKKELQQEQLLMSHRSYMSRRVHWSAETYLKIQAVRIESFLERNKRSSRYSSYTKGYGESHPSAHFKRTSPSAELDGKDDLEPKDISLKEIRKLLVLNSLDLKTKSRRKKT